MSEPDEFSANHVKAMDCPSCGGGIELQAAGYSTYFVCQYCGSELDLLSDDVRLIAEHAEAAEALYIPLGTRGTLRGVEWVTIGNLKKTDGWEKWDEFLLFNPYHGYRWLVFTKDGWSFGTPILAQPERLPGGSYLYDGAGMKICYYFADSTTQSALGEFYWRAQRGDVVRSASYVGGGRMLSCEDAGSEYNWTLEEWIASSEVARVRDSRYRPISRNRRYAPTPSTQPARGQGGEQGPDRHRVFPARHSGRDHALLRRRDTHKGI